MNKEQRQAFAVGSWVGVAQAFVGISVSLRFGGVAAFVSTLVTYVVLYKMYAWAIGPKEAEDETK